jgi:ribosomal protein L7/L12
MAQNPCPSCGASVDLAERACPYCGAAIAVSSSAPTLLNARLDRDLLKGQVGGADADSEAFREIREQITRGKKIEAIRLYRELTGASLKEAKDAIEDFEMGRSVIGAPAAVAAFSSSAEAMDEIKRLLRGGNKIEAIKVHREYFSTGLKDAKDAVDAIESDLKFQAAPARPSLGQSAGQPSSFAPSEPVMSANPFDEPGQSSQAGRKWLIGCSVAFVLFCCLCVVLPALIYALFSGQGGGF